MLYAETEMKVQKLIGKMMGALFTRSIYSHSVLIINPKIVICI